MNKLLLGRYIHADSFVHKLDARAKLFLSFYFIVIIFLCNNWQTYTLLGILTLVSVVCSKIKLKFFWDGIRPLVWLIIFTGESDDKLWHGISSATLKHPIIYLVVLAVVVVSC